MEHADRHLATILSADVAGYSRLTGAELRRQPGLSTELVRQAYSVLDAEAISRYLEGLRKAGWVG